MKGKEINFKCLGFAIAAIVFVICSHAEELCGRVVKVADGDTITLIDSEKVQYKIRLDRIDAPEKGQAFGDASKKHLSSLVFGKDVRVEWEKKDRYGRILGIVFAGTNEVNLAQINAGMAWHYKYFDKTPAYAVAEVEARQKRIGLWVDKAPIDPYEFRQMRRNRR